MNLDASTANGAPTTEPIEKTKAAFLKDCVRIPLSNLIYLKTLRPRVKDSITFQQVLSSVRDVGLVEPPVVFPHPTNQGHYFVMDGHLRIEALKTLGIAEVDCLVATDDDTYTYNKRINRMTVVQAHKMIVKAMEHGVSAERLGKTLHLSPATIRNHFRLLDGVCPEVIEQLQDKPCPAKSFAILRRMKPIRQIEAAELMSGQNNFTTAFANALLYNTPSNMLVTQAAASDTVSVESMAKMEREMAALQVQNKAIEETYGPDVLHLAVLKRFLEKWMDCAPIVRWLAANQPEYFREFQSIVGTMQIDDSRSHGAAAQQSRGKLA